MTDDPSKHKNTCNRIRFEDDYICPADFAPFIYYPHAACTCGADPTPVAPDDTPTRLLDDETIHFSSCGLLDSSSDVCDCQIAELRAEVSRLREALQEANEDGDESAIFLSQANDALFKAEAEVSRLQQENARLQAENGLLKRSLGILERTISEAEGR